MQVYRTTGLRLVLLGAALAAVRTVVAGGWLPHSGKGVLLFTLAELSLIPLGLLLLLCSLLLGIVEAHPGGREESSPGTARGSRAIGAVLVVLVFMVALFAVPRSPEGFWGVVFLAVAALSLFLAPLGLPLLVWLLSVREARRAGRDLPSPALAGLSLLLVVVFVIALFPMLSRGLGWGRYGVPIEEPLRDLHDVTTLAGIPVPREAKLVKGTIRWGNPNRYVYAVMTMPNAEAHRFLQGQGGWRWWVVPAAELPISGPQEMKQDLARKPRVIYATGDNVQRPDPSLPMTTVAISRGEGGRATLYLYWVPVV